MLTALFASGAAASDGFPCGIASIKPLRGTVEFASMVKPTGTSRRASSST